MPINLNQHGRFGRYELIRRISLGGMAEVFKAKSYTDAGFEKVVALKRLLPSYSQNEAFVEMFLQEARIAAQLRHDSICPLYELGQVERDYYLTMEFIYGYDLRQSLKRLKQNKTTMDPWLCAFIALRVSEALDYAWTALDADGHAFQLVHRDISPQNIMVGFDGSVRIIDFGIAKIANSTVQTAAGVLKGKYAYMSPEHAGAHPVDRRSDIWSLGVVMHEQLSGKRLFSGGSVADTIDQVLARPIPKLPNVPPSIQAIVSRMLSRHPDSRYHTHRDLAEALAEALDNAPHRIDETGLSQWMEQLFPADKRIEHDLTDADVRLVFSAEERGDETTDVQSDVSSATRIFMADSTGQADYRAVLEQLMAEGRVATTGHDTLAQAEEVPAVPVTSNDDAPPWRDFFASTLCVAGLLIWLLL